MKISFRTCMLIISYPIALLASSISAQESLGLNTYCDPIGTMYPGGTPLFNESTGTRISLEDYLESRGLNLYCDPIGTVYAGGSPLFDETTGRYITREEYLKRKK